MNRPNAEPLSVDHQLRRLKSIVATAVARRLANDPAASEHALGRERLRPNEIEWVRDQHIDRLTLSRLIRIAVALGCKVSISVE